MSTNTPVPSEPNPSQVDRRAFLKYVGGGATAAMMWPGLSKVAEAATAGDPAAWVTAKGVPNFTPVSYPVPMPGDAGDAASDAKRLAKYVVQDDIVLPDGFGYDVVAAWGDTFGPEGQPEKQVTFGFNADYTGLVAIPGSKDEYWLAVNHEYISAKPWLQGYEQAHGEKLPELKLVADDKRFELTLDGIGVGSNSIDLADRAVLASLDPKAADGLRQIARAGLRDLGVSVLRVRRLADGRFVVVKNAWDHRQFNTLGVINGDPVVRVRAAGMDRSLDTTAPGTFSNCSGGTSPWGTILTCEENFQNQVPEFITPAGDPLPGFSQPFAGHGKPDGTGLPTEFTGLGQGGYSDDDTTPLDGRVFGWVAEIDPARGTMVKHKSLGRNRHENVALRVEAGKPLAAYMGDDRRGGHVWKYVSRDVVRDPSDPANTALLDDGTLYVAKFNGDYTGEWVALHPDTPLVEPEPEHCCGQHMWLPRRPEGGFAAVSQPGAKKHELTPEQWVKSVEWFTNQRFYELRLRDLVTPKIPADAASWTPEQRDLRALDLLLTDAYSMANAIGGTPTARPEDLEVHPIDKSVYIAFTDNTGSGDGYPDARVFPDSGKDSSRQYGAVYRIVEDGNEPGATTFAWGKFVGSGEIADEGGGFACADNLVFDPQGNLWMVTDISTSSHNFPVDREGPSAPGQKRFPGVFGNNALFVIPTRGPKAGVPHCFAIGPMECEMTGPTFTDDGKTLILSVQHPGEKNGARNFPGVDRPAEEVRTIKITGRDGTIIEQQRIVPLGSNFPSGKPGDVPRPCVVCITRKT